MAACSTCQEIEEALDQLAQEFKGQLRFVRININNDIIPALTGPGGVIALPSYRWLFTQEDMHKPFGKHEKSQLRKKLTAIANKQPMQK